MVAVLVGDLFVEVAVVVASASETVVGFVPYSEVGCRCPFPFPSAGVVDQVKERLASGVEGVESLVA